MSKKKKENATGQARTYPSTLKRLRRMALDHDADVPEIIDRLSKTGDPSDPKKTPPAAKNLKAAGKAIALKTSDMHEPAQYFKSRTGLYVGSEFNGRILSGAMTTKEGSSFKVVNFDLVETSTDEQIEASLPKKHLFSNSDVCAIVAELVAKQKNGEAGTLITTGYANLFYTEGGVVYVGWRADDREWLVYAWRRGGHGWVAGYRVFSPVN